VHQELLLNQLFRGVKVVTIEVVTGIYLSNRWTFGIVAAFILESSVLKWGAYFRN
jgi:hypothetical protein